jgi:hypothetical protein
MNLHGRSAKVCVEAGIPAAAGICRLLRALLVRETLDRICELRWASISELYRSEVLGEKELLLPGIE